jgi:cytoplasmic iron level regulating protein YaaA (DUF328/UPF0246 family)
LKTLGLISCIKRKQNYHCKASEMYRPSDLFRKAYAYCKKNYDLVAIFSAKYGLLLPNDPIWPYNVTLNDMNVKERKVWSEKVFKQMQKSLELDRIGIVSFHAGKKYREHIIPKLEARSIECRVPLGNLRIGKQLNWYKKHLGRYLSEF